MILLVDGIPVAASHESPYAMEWDTVGWPSGTFSIEARAYARHAGTFLWQSDAALVKLLPQGAYTEGDVNHDGAKNVSDIHACVNHILGTQDRGTAADVNGDGLVNILDVQRIVRLLSTN